MRPRVGGLTRKADEVAGQASCSSLCPLPSPLPSILAWESPCPLHCVAINPFICFTSSERTFPITQGILGFREVKEGAQGHRAN